MFVSDKLKSVFTKELEILHRARFYIVGCVLLFFLGIALGWFWPGYFQEIIRDFFSKLKEQVGDSPDLKVIALIFFRNSVAAFLAVEVGAFLFFLPAICVVLNGGVMGTLASILAANSEFNLFTFVLRVIPHGIFELPALFIACGLGTWSGLSLVIRKEGESWRDKKRMSRRVLYRVVSLLLAIAAIIEGSLIILLV